MLEHLYDMTLQHAFDVASIYLLTQPKSSREKDNSACRYRHIEDGKCVNMCIVGVFIPESVYDSGCENQIVDFSFDDVFEKRPDLMTVFRALQVAHDMFEGDTLRYYELVKIAKHFDLNTVILDNVFAILPAWGQMLKETIAKILKEETE